MTKPWYNISFPFSQYSYCLCNFQKSRSSDFLPYLISLFFPAGNEQEGRGKQISFICYSWFWNSRFISTNPTMLRKCSTAFKVFNSVVSCFTRWQLEWSYFRYSCNQCIKFQLFQTMFRLEYLVWWSQMIQLLALYTLLDFMAKLQSFRASVLRAIVLKSLIPILHLSINNVGHKVYLCFCPFRWGCMCSMWGWDGSPSLS